jgi:hypothetical protein
MDSTPGRGIWEEVEQRRLEADRMLVLCSSESLLRDGVLKEIERQVDEDPTKIIPVSLDETWRQPGFHVVRGGADLKPFLLRQTLADFGNESRYAESLERLLTGLRRKPRRQSDAGR